MEIRYAAGSLMGASRHSNHDNLCVNGVILPEVHGNILDLTSGVIPYKEYPLSAFAVFDGSGTSMGGATASYLAANIFSRYQETDSSVPQNARMPSILSNIHRSICQFQTERRLDVMGTTAAVLSFYGDTTVWSSFGNSRIYRISHGCCTLISDVPSEPALLGDPSALPPHFSAAKREPIPDHTFYLLCTDGLSSCLEDQEILRIVTEALDVPTGVQDLLRTAAAKDAEDDVTVILCQTC